MKSFFRINLPLASILTRLTIFAVLAIFFINSPTPALAACTPTEGTCGALYACNILSGGESNKYCCNTPAECTLQRSATGVTTTQTGSVKSSGILEVDPEDGCAGGVNTALGCIPYDTNGFAGALLRFLVGIVGLIALVVMLVATIMIMTGGANPEQVKKGKELFTGGITGLFFIVFSVTLLRIIAGDIIQLPGF